ncbi:MAG TPA: asparaginase domain-containing protein [Paracoccaceae bacterium]|nr:asparaginase domain-containing protein [Paracoccaceae bacterium]
MANGTGRLVVVHTGGTIAMAPGAAGLMPRAGLLEGALARLAPGLAVEVVALDPLIDSADMTPGLWNAILDRVASAGGAPVIVTHGTDTLAFTGAALTQALGAVGVPVVLTGAMAPLGTGGDAEGNLGLALRAAQDGPNGVWLAFAGRVLPAGRLAKTDSHGADAFVSVAEAPAPDGPARRFGSARVGIVTLSPGLPAEAVGAGAGGTAAAVLRIYGAGTVAGDPALIAALAGAVAQRKRLRAVSQCLTGGLSPGAYAAGAAIWAAGVENGGDETAEAALVRLMLDLGAR